MDKNYYQVVFDILFWDEHEHWDTLLCSLTFFETKLKGKIVIDEDKPEAKRWRSEGENEGISAAGSRTVREPRVVVQTMSDIDNLDDGYIDGENMGKKWSRGIQTQEYKCTSPGCPVRKPVERASHDLRAMITTCEGKHNHDIPAARGSGSHRPLPDNDNDNNNNNGNNNATMAIRSSTVNNHSNNAMNNNPIRGLRTSTAEGESPFMLEILQGNENFGFSGFGNLGDLCDALVDKITVRFRS